MFFSNNPGQMPNPLSDNQTLLKGMTSVLSPRNDPKDPGYENSKSKSGTKKHTKHNQEENNGPMSAIASWEKSMEGGYVIEGTTPPTQHSCKMQPDRAAREWGQLLPTQPQTTAQKHHGVTSAITPLLQSFGRLLSPP